MNKEKAIDYWFKMADYTHNLLALCAGLNLILTGEHQDFFAELNPLNIEARYPEMQEKLGKTINKKKANILLRKTRSAYKWLKSRKK
jgi:hypothetical protein